MSQLLGTLGIAACFQTGSLSVELQQLFFVLVVAAHGRDAEADQASHAKPRRCERDVPEQSSAHSANACLPLWVLQCLGPVTAKLLMPLACHPDGVAGVLRGGSRERREHRAEVPQHPHPGFVVLVERTLGGPVTWPDHGAEFIHDPESQSVRDGWGVGPVKHAPRVVLLPLHGGLDQCGTGSTPRVAPFDEVGLVRFKPVLRVSDETNGLIHMLLGHTHTDKRSLSHTPDLRSERLAAVVAVDVGIGLYSLVGHSPGFDLVVWSVKQVISPAANRSVLRRSKTAVRVPKVFCGYEGAGSVLADECGHDLAGLRSHVADARQSHAGRGAGQGVEWVLPWRYRLSGDDRGVERAYETRLHLSDNSSGVCDVLPATDDLLHDGPERVLRSLRSALVKHGGPCVPGLSKVCIVQNEPCLALHCRENRVRERERSALQFLPGNE